MFPFVSEFYNLSDAQNYLQESSHNFDRSYLCSSVTTVVLVMSTQNGAKALGLEATLGTVEVGKNADLVVLEEDPGKDVSAFRSITHVMRFGKLHRIADLSYADEKAVD